MFASYLLLCRYCVDEVIPFQQNALHVKLCSAVQLKHYSQTEMFSNA